MNFFLNGEFLCFTLLSNLVKKFLCKTLRRRASLEKLIWYMEWCINFAFLTHSTRASVYRYIERQWYLIWSSLPDYHNSAETYDIVYVKSFWKLICSCYFLKKVFCFGHGSWPWGPLFKKICKNLCTIQVGPKNGNF